MRNLMLILALLAASPAFAQQQFHSLAKMMFDDGPTYYGMAHVDFVDMPWGHQWTITVSLPIAAEYVPVVDYDMMRRSGLWFVTDTEGVSLKPPGWAHLRLYPESEGDPTYAEFIKWLRDPDGMTYGTRQVYIGMARSGKRQLTIYIVD